MPSAVISEKARFQRRPQNSARLRERSGAEWPVVGRSAHYLVVLSVRTDPHPVDACIDIRAERAVMIADSD